MQIFSANARKSWLILIFNAKVPPSYTESSTCFELLWSLRCRRTEIKLLLRLRARQYCNFDYNERIMMFTGKAHWQHIKHISSLCAADILTCRHRRSADVTNNAESSVTSDMINYSSNHTFSCSLLSKCQFSVIKETGSTIRLIAKMVPIPRMHLELSLINLYNALDSPCCFGASHNLQVLKESNPYWRTSVAPVVGDRTQRSLSNIKETRT